MTDVTGRGGHASSKLGHGELFETTRKQYGKCKTGSRRSGVERDHRRPRQRTPAQSQRRGGEIRHEQGQLRPHPQTSELRNCARGQGSPHRHEPQYPGTYSGHIGPSRHQGPQRGTD